MGKDPAFLFYSKDWLEGTAELTPEQKGVYIDLLCHQHQKKSLPLEHIKLARLAGISIEKFEEIWIEIGQKFKAIEGRYINIRLEKEGIDRAIKSHKNKIIAIFSVLLRQADLDKKNYLFIRKNFKVSEFEHINSERLSEAISEWFNERLKSIEDGNVIANETVNEDANANEEKGGTGGKTKKESEYQNFMAVYCDFYKSQTGINPEIQIQDGAALKKIIKYFTKEAKEGHFPLDGFKYIFSKWGDLDEFNQKQINLTQIYSNINTIILQLRKKIKKNGSATNTSNESYGQDFTDRANNIVDKIYGSQK